VGDEMKKGMRLVILIVSIMVTASCEKQYIPNGPVRQETQSPTQSPAKNTTANPSRDQSTRQPIFPTVQPANTVIPTIAPTFTPMPTVTPTDLPTLTSQEADKAVQEYMQTNAGCKDCFWGIVPGKTTLGETRNFITMLSSMSQYSELEPSHFDVFFGLKGGLFSIEPLFHYDNSLIIDGISVVFGVDNPGVTREDWSFYHPDNILRMYGIPSQVSISTAEGPTQPGEKRNIEYFMDLYFDQSNMIIEYGYPEVAILGSTEYTVCPTWDRVTSLEVWYGEHKDNPPVIRPNENQLLNLSNESFYQQMIPKDGGKCIKLKAVQ
jgi:hypothetical protein